MDTYIIINKTTKIVSNRIKSESLPVSSSNEIILPQSNYSDEVLIGSLYVSESNSFSPPLRGYSNLISNDDFSTSGEDAPIGLDIENYIFSKSLFEIEYSEDLSTEISNSHFIITNGTIINFTQNTKGCSINIDPIDSVKSSTDEVTIAIDYNNGYNNDK